MARNSYMKGNESIFRDEALKHKENYFIGNFTISPISILPITLWCSIFIFLLITMIFFLSYAQRVPVKGHVIYKPAAAEIISNKSGVIKNVYFSQNDKVKRGDVIATISRDVMYSDGAVNKNSLKLSNIQIIELEKQEKSLLKEKESEKNNLNKVVVIKEMEIKAIESAINSELENNSYLKKRMVHYQRLFNDRITTEQEKINRENEYFNSMTQLKLHQINLAKVMSEKQNLIVELDKLNIQKNQLVIEINQKKSLLKQQVINYSSQIETHVVAPIDGVISIINIQYGQRVTAGKTIAIVVPEKAKPYIEMWVPPSALQEVKIGQDVLMRIESLPWQWFGKVRGRIELISKSPKELSDELQNFRLLINLNNEIELPLGVNVEADILTTRHKIWQWIFLPTKNQINRILDED